MSVENLVKEYSNMLFRICMVILCNEQDAQDVLQDTFCRYIEKAIDFRDKEHEKAWHIRTGSEKAYAKGQGRTEVYVGIAHKFIPMFFGIKQRGALI